MLKGLDLGFGLDGSDIGLGLGLRFEALALVLALL